MMRLTLSIGLGAALALGACSKDDKDPGPGAGKPPPAAETVGADGVRRVPVEAGMGGYKPDKITARPGESLVLVVTRTADGECLSQIKVADGPVLDLPMNTPVEIPVSAPDSGQVRFACGMDMATGVIAVN
jgi:plastocyanin domain-containing protein